MFSSGEWVEPQGADPLPSSFPTSFDSPEEFGRALIETLDLDPVYVAVHNGPLGFDQLARWLVAYWCFYHAGVASALSEVAQPHCFWGEMKTAANSRRTPRGRERRHFRGELARSSLAQLSERWANPVAWVEALWERRTAREVISDVRRERGFGPWIAFKIADMIERLGAPITFDSDVLMYDEPSSAALAIANERGFSGTAEARVLRVADGLAAALADLSAPPLHERAIGFQEVETVLCKWKAHRAGRYPLGIDSRELVAALQWNGPRGFSGTAMALLQRAPRPRWAGGLFS